MIWNAGENQLCDPVARIRHSCGFLIVQLHIVLYELNFKPEYHGRMEKIPWRECPGNNTPFILCKMLIYNHWFHLNPSSNNSRTLVPGGLYPLLHRFKLSPWPRERSGLTLGFRITWQQIKILEISMWTRQQCTHNFDVKFGNYQLHVLLRPL
jgi:hypothetical protein